MTLSNGDRAAEEAIRRWITQFAPEQASERAINRTIERLRETRQPRMFELRLPLPMAAAVALLAVVLVGGLALRAGLVPLPAGNAPSPSPTPSGTACSLEIAASGAHITWVGRGFAPGTDVTLEIDRANGSHLTLDRSAIASLHTDEQGRFAVELVPFSEDVGRGVITAVAGCSATLAYTVTADQIQAACIDPTIPQALMDGGAYRDAVEADSPVHWWHLDEASGGAAVDAAADADGERQGAVAAITGSDGTGAAWLPGDGGSYIGIPQLTLDEFTIEAWVLLCDYADNQDAIVGNSEQPPDVNFFEGRLRLFAGGEAGDVVVASSVVPIATWQHWAITRDSAGTTRIYRNGVVDAVGANWDGPMVIIEIGRGSAGTLRGALDELAIYDRALTEEEIRAHAMAR